MKINILTIFPEMFAPLRESMLGRAEEKGILEFNIVDIREFTTNKHKRVDDTPYGGGAGMVMQVQPILDAYRGSDMGGQVIYMSPRGEILSQEIAEELSGLDEITILCGHYEGVDQRVLDLLDAREISIGDYVLTGGELPAMVLIDTVARFIEGVLASEESAMEESVYSGLLEYPHYSKPREIEGLEVPEVLTSGNHGEIDLWRFEKAVELTAERRPEMLEKYVKSGREFSKRERMILEKNTR
ncbi:MAG: tRNA (guanosine(37)-N1)-methyltransferase TrmD [Firmicutes bacterium]|nr:tRNA (guanosine(37)-N1)-methyltransferase TrmD [Bacillota bacterium]